MNNDELLKSISNKLSAILFVSLSSNIAKQNTAEKVAVLARLGLANQEIADVLGTTRGTVEVLKSRARKKK
jgi:DNA-binding NarL/FixJ family response regulator